MKPINAVRETATGSRSPAGPRRLETATRMSASLSRRLSAFFGSAPGQDPKAAKFAVLSPGRAGFPNHAKRSEGSDTTPSETPRVSPCKPLCARLGAGVACVPAKPLETSVAAFVPEVLKPNFYRVLFLVGSEVEMPASNGQQRKQGSRRSPAKRVRWEEETQWNE